MGSSPRYSPELPSRDQHSYKTAPVLRCPFCALSIPNAMEKPSTMLIQQLRSVHSSQRNVIQQLQADNPAISLRFVGRETPSERRLRSFARSRQNCTTDWMERCQSIEI
ncbi:hypothetical protein BDR06DRAFT_180954 [Suillus hirtellus]|nr:hypothetical protein BDR06DRAFT_180954 [Suillus hirtellus]